jgi:hypothetical protein
MDKKAFNPDTRYTLVHRDATGRSRPMNIYAYRAYAEFLVARDLSGAGLLRKIPYGEIERIVRAEPVAPEARYLLPAGILDERNWRDRAAMQHYATSPGRGK